MRVLFKSAPVTTMKVLSESDAPGSFEALVSVFGVVDSDGDVVMPGAFTKTLAAGPKAIVHSHDWQAAPIGQTVSAEETSDGLLVKGRLFVAPGEDHARAREVYAAMRGGALTEFSWGGRVTSETRKEDDNGDVTYELNEIDLVEYGPCLKGANPSTRLLAVKSIVQAGVMTREEARVALGVDVAKTDTPEPPADPPAVDPAVAPLGDDSDTDGDDVDTDGPQIVAPADDGWSSTLAAVRAGVLTTTEARARLGLPVLPADDAAPAEASVAPAAAPVSTSLARTLASLRLHA
ncbi:MAG: HK97 family phage prohead protease [Solirubrobacteraceae bacterium]